MTSAGEVPAALGDEFFHPGQRVASTTTLDRLILFSMISVVFAVVLFTAAAALIHAQRLMTSTTLSHLDSVASVQSNRVRETFRHREIELALLASRTQMRISLADYVATGSADARERVERILGDAIRAAPDFLAVHVLDPGGGLVASAGDLERSQLPAEVLAAIAESGARQAERAFADADGQAHFILAAPLELERERVGFIVAESTGQDYVTITSDYTGLGESGETVLARLDDDGTALFLVPLRFDPDAAFNRRLAATETDVPVMRALQGETGLSEHAVNYRGVPALASMRRIEESGWGLAVIMDRSEAFANLNGLRIGFAAVTLLALFFGALVARRTARLLRDSIRRLTRKAAQLESGDHHAKPAYGGRRRAFSELLQLERAYDSMTGHIVEQADALLAKATELEQQYQEKSAALVKLRETQDQLLAREKLAYLGEQLSSLTHEVNTPLGVTLTALDTMRMRLGELEQVFEQSQMTRTDLENFLEHSVESMEISRRSLDRAVSIMRSFKVVAVDQASDRDRSFMLAEYVDEIVLTLLPKFRSTGLVVLNEVAADVQVRLNAGALSQVLTNLLVNAQVHAYAGMEGGEVRVASECDGEALQIQVSDRGRGMSEDERVRAFEEFFTTRADDGGSGIGLHLVHTLVRDELHGEVEMHSAPGEGTRFVIRIPGQHWKPAVVADDS